MAAAKFKVRPHTTRHTFRPRGFGRLITLATTLALLMYGHGLSWWAGLVLAGLILLAVGHRGHPRGGAWMASGTLMALAFSHTHILTFWQASLMLALCMGGFLVSLSYQKPDLEVRPRMLNRRPQPYLPPLKSGTAFAQKGHHTLGRIRRGGQF